MENQLTVIDPKEYGIEETKALTISNAFTPKIVERDGLTEVYKNILTKEITPELVIEANDLRKKLVKVRTGIDGIHKTEKAFYLASGKYVDALKNKLTLPVEQMEEKLQEIVSHFEKIEAEKVKAIHSERVEKLIPFGYEIGATNFGIMDDNMFNAIFVGAETTHKAKVETEQKAESERIEKERLEAEEKEKQRLENERLKTENEAKEKQLESERIEAEKKQAELKAKADAELAEHKRLADLEAKKQAAILAEEKSKADKLAAELKSKSDEEAKAKRALIDEENKRIEYEKKAAKAPDRDKLRLVAMQLSEVKSMLPDLKTEEGKKILENIKVLIDKTIFYTKEQTEKL